MAARHAFRSHWMSPQGHGQSAIARRDSQTRVRSEDWKVESAIRPAHVDRFLPPAEKLHRRPVLPKIDAVLRRRAYPVPRVFELER